LGSFLKAQIELAGSPAKERNRWKGIKEKNRASALPFMDLRLVLLRKLSVNLLFSLEINKN